jgi:hypothetical protein
MESTRSCSKFVGGQDSWLILVSSVQMQFKDVLTMKDLHTAMNAHWCSNGGSKKKKSEDNQLKIISAFGGFCFSCKQKGHKAHECAQKKVKVAGKFAAKCKTATRWGINLPNAGRKKRMIPSTLTGIRKKSQM